MGRSSSSTLRFPGTSALFTCQDQVPLQLHGAQALPGQSSKTLAFHLPCGWLLTHGDGGTWGLRFSVNCGSGKGTGADVKGLNPPGVTLPTTSKMICFRVFNTFSSLTTTYVHNLRDPLNSQAFYARKARFCYCITRERAL